MSVCLEEECALQTSPNEALPRIWFYPDSLQDYLDKSIKSLTATNVDHMFTVANEISVEVGIDESQQIVVQLAPHTRGTLVIADTWVSRLEMSGQRKGF